MDKNSLKQDYAIVFDTPEGKRVLADLMGKCAVLAPSFVVGDQYMTAFNEGKRSVVLNILAVLKYKPADFPKLAEDTLDGWRGSR